MFLIIILISMVSSSCFAFDLYGDPDLVVKLMQARQHELEMQNTVAQNVMRNNEVAGHAAYLTSFFGAAYALGGYCVALSCTKNYAFKKRLHTCCKAVMATGVLCIGAYAGYQVPMEVWQSTGDAQKMLYASILSEIGSVCIGSVIGTLSS